MTYNWGKDMFLKIFSAVWKWAIYWINEKLGSLKILKTNLL
jgi:hypothetical protein